MAELNKTLREQRIKLGLSQQKVADSIGVTLKSYQYYEAGDRNPKYDKLVKLEQVLGIKLVTNVPRNTLAEEAESEYNTAKGVTLINTNAGVKDYLSKRREIKNNGDPFMVPLVPVAAQAGYSKSYTDPVFINQLKVYPILPGIDPHGTAWRYFEVEGDSMEDTFTEGQYLLASQVIKEDWRDIQNFYVYVIITTDKVMVKRLAKVKGKDYWACISDNEEKYKQFRLPVTEVKELWKYRRHIDWDASPPKKFIINV